jgi:hypothetical protein
MAGSGKVGGGKKNRKFSRNRAKCEAYAAAHKRYKNGPQPGNKRGDTPRTPHDPERMKH